MNERDEVRNLCERTGHRWQEEYYGYKCENCGDFIPYGCEPWMPLDDLYDEDGEPDFTLDELEWQETYPELCDMEDSEL